MLTLTGFFFLPTRHFSGLKLFYNLILTHRILHNKSGSSSSVHKYTNMHPNVLLKQHYGKAALNHNGTTKGLFVLPSVFTHAAFRRGPDNTAATLTFTLHSHCSALVVAQALAERSLYASPKCVCVCVYVCPAPRRVHARPALRNHLCDPSCKNAAV